jgi:hypothetical protein
VSVGGFEIPVTLTLHVDTREFFTADTTAETIDGTLYTVDDDRPTPVSGKLCKYRGKDYRIATAKLSPCASFISLELVDRNK